MIIKLVIPVYNDWQSVNKLIERISNELNFSEGNISIIILNDSSSEKPPENYLNFENISNIKIINLSKNIGHARAIATGLKYIFKDEKFDYIIPMDADGEDRPEEIKSLLNETKLNPDLPIVCERVKRSEGLLFKFCYFIHKLITFIFTGKSIKFGNFCCIPMHTVQKMINEKASWSSFSGSLKKISKKLVGIPSERGKRYFGPSKMSFKNLIIHSLSIIGVFKYVVLFRSILFFVIYFLLIVKNLTIITSLPLILIFIFNVLVFLVSKRENLEDYNNSLHNISDIKIIK